MLILPIRTSIRPYRTPYVNYALIAANIIVFVLSYYPHRVMVGGQIIPEVLRQWAQPLMLESSHPQVWQFISSAFLHGGWMHIIGNMFFLYLFGNNVNDKLGNLGYLCFYFGGAVFSGIGHVLFSASPAIGASGAVAAVTGAYLVLFPKTLITVFYWMIFVGTTEIYALYFVAFKMILLDNVIVKNTANVAYDAHLAGYAFGIVSILLMLALGLIRGSQYDLWAMIKRWNQRRVYRGVIKGGYDPFKGTTTAKPVKAKEVKKSKKDIEKQQQIMDARAEISKRLGETNLPAAAELYVELLHLDINQILPREQLLNIANQLAGSEHHAEAAIAYEQFLSHYGKYEYSEQVQLMLGVVYARYLNRPKEAIEHLQAAKPKLTDPGQIKMCDEELGKLTS